MKHNTKSHRFFSLKSLAILATMMVLGVGCASTGTHQAIMPMDSPAHHVVVGEQMLAAGEMEAARAALETALAAAPNYGPAHAGMARLYARQGNIADALTAVKSAISNAADPAQEVAARLVKMEILAESGPEPDIDEMESEYKRIQKTRPGHPESSLVMAGAYTRAGRTDEAEPLFDALVKAGGPGAAVADRQWKEMQTRRRLESDMRAASELAGLSLLTRAQAAALIAEELKGWNLLAAKAAGAADHRFRTPEEDKAVEKPGIAAVPSDAADHPLARSIAIVLGLRLRGLDLSADGRFHPEAPMTRADMALALEDLLIIIEDDEGLARRLVGGPSPFADVAPDYYAFNAILFCVSRDLMHAVEKDRFYPERPVSGMAALQGIQRVKARH